MSKYIDMKTLTAGRKAEAAKRSNGSFFSSKEENDECFNKYAGKELQIVGTANIPARDDIPSFNVVLFDDAHQLSTSRFFNAKGIKWPVGGNIAKWDYINACIANGTKLVVTPEKVVVGEERAVAGSDRKFQPVTYYFQECALPKTDMSVLASVEEGE